MWQPLEVFGSQEADFADRVWLAFQALPRNEFGELPVETKVEEAGNLSRGVLGKIFCGMQRSFRDSPRLASALGTTTEFLLEGRGAWPALSWPPRERIVTHADGKRVPEMPVPTKLGPVPRVLLPLPLRRARASAVALLLNEDLDMEPTDAAAAVEAVVGFAHRRGTTHVVPNPAVIVNMARAFINARGHVGELADEAEITRMGLNLGQDRHPDLHPAVAPPSVPPDQPEERSESEEAQRDNRPAKRKRQQSAHHLRPSRKP
jgi:hypothetical protein